MVINTSSRMNQVKEYLLNYIEQNRLVHQDQLPSETAIAKTLGVSRNTLREAYIQLEKEGVIIRKHGLGTFVAHSPLIHDSLNDFMPFTQMIEEGGFTPKYQTISMGYETAPADVCDVFSSSPAKKVWSIKRVVRADQEPAIYAEDFLTPAINIDGMNWDVLGSNMLQFISTSLNIQLHHLQSYIRAAALSPEISEYLELKSGAPILSVRSIVSKEDDQPIVYSKICFNSNIIELNIVRMIHKP